MMRSRVCLFVVAVGCLARTGTVHAQLTAPMWGALPPSPAVTNTERLLLLQLGNRRLSNADFQRQLIALQPQLRAERRRADQSFRQQSTNQAAAAERQRIQNALTQTRSAPAPADLQGNARTLPSEGTVPETDVDADWKSDVVAVWRALGATFSPADPAVVTAIDSRFDTGMLVQAIRVDGPADKAGLHDGDILLGLYRFRTKNYSDIAYVIELPEIATVQPLNAVILREKKVLTVPVKLDLPAAASR